jgi:hypothetical protein
MGQEDICPPAHVDLLQLVFLGAESAGFLHSNGNLNHGERVKS